MPGRNQLTHMPTLGVTLTEPGLPSCSYRAVSAAYWTAAACKSQPFREYPNVQGDEDR